MTSHLYVPTQTEITAAAEPFIAAIEADRQKAADAGRLTEDVKEFLAGKTARITRAGQLLAAGAVDYEDGYGWKVDSQQERAPKWQPGADPADDEACGPYHVGSDHCSCYYSRNHDGDCKHILAARMYHRIIIAQLDSAINDEDSGIYAIECRTPNLYAVYDRETDVPVCGAYYVSRTGVYRPETGKDAAAFARWLIAHPVEFYPGGLLERLLRTAPGANLALHTDVIFGSPRRYILTGYRFDGRTWTDLEYLDRQEFTPLDWEALVTAAGWALTSRPVKQAGYGYSYALERAKAGQKVYAVTGADMAKIDQMLNGAPEMIEVARTGEVLG